MKQVLVDIPQVGNIVLELDDNVAPKTVDLFIKNLPFKVNLNLWGEEIYTDPSPINAGGENTKSIVELFDVAYWPPGKAVCLFYGSTPISTKNQIKPYSPVNVIGKIKNPDKNILKKIHDGTLAIFSVPSLS